MCFSSLLVWARSAFNIFAIIRTAQGAFPFSKHHHAALISCVMGVSFIFILWCWFWGVLVKHFLEVFSLTGKFCFFILQKFPIHAAVCLFFLLVSCLMMFYSSLYLLFSDPVCTLLAFSAIHLLLSSLTIFLTTLIFLQSGLDSLWSCAVYLCLDFFFVSSISFQVLLLIQGLFFPFLKHVLIRIFTVLTVRICSPLSIKFGV